MTKKPSISEVRKAEIIADILKALQTVNSVAFLDFLLHQIYAFKEKWGV